MDSIALQLAIKYATKSGKITLAQKITDELIEQKKDQEEKKKNYIERSLSPTPTPPTSIPSYSSSSLSSIIFEEVKEVRSKVTTSNAPFNNPFRKKNVTNTNNEISTDELSKWKPSINKSRLVTTNKTTIQEVNNDITIENEDNLSNGKRKIDENDDNTKNKRNRLQQFACNR